MYLGEGLQVRLRWAHAQGSKYFEIFGEVAELSTEGMAIAFLPHETEKLPNLGETVDLSVRIASNQAVNLRALVVHRSPARYGGLLQERLGLSYYQEPRLHSSFERRRRKRFFCPPPFQPTAFCHEAIFMQEFISFQVEEISGKGACFVTASKNINIIPGLVMSVDLHIPTEGVIPVSVQVVGLRRRKDTQHCMVSVVWLNASDELLIKLGNYLFFHGQASLKELDDSDLLYLDTFKGLRIIHPQTERDWEDILDLRFIAYKAAGKFQDAKTKHDMFDQYDHFSRHLICKIGDKPIASARIVFVGRDRERSEHANTLKIDVPDWLWEAGFVELSRACTLPEYRGGDVYTVVMRHIARIIYQSGLRYALANCNDNLWSLYSKIGFKKTGIRFEAFGTKDCNLIYADIERLLNAKDGSFVGYNLVPYHSARYVLAREDYIRLKTRFLLALHNLIHPFLRWVVWWTKRRRKRS